MAHRRLIFRERITAIVGSVILFGLVLLSYWYSVQSEIAGLKYIPSDKSPDFLARNVSLTDFDETGQPKYKAFSENLQHFSDERMHAEKALVLSLAPGEAFASARADELWSNDGMETVEFSGNVEVTREPWGTEPELYFRTNFLRAWLDTLRFETNEPVFMRRGENTTESEGGAIYDNVARTIELRDRVTTILQPKSLSADAP